MTTKPLISALLISMLSTASIAAAHEMKQSVAIRFDARVGAAPFVCGKSYDDIGVTHSRITPSDYRFYVFDVALIDEHGHHVPVALKQDGVWQYKNVALLDFENGKDVCRNGNSGINKQVRGSVPHGNYVGIEYTMGLPFELNHGDATIAPSPLNFTAMFWNWQGGYRFLKIDMGTTGQVQDTRLDSEIEAELKAKGKTPADFDAAGFPIHIGSAGCAGASRTAAPPGPCKFPNLVKVQFDHFDVNRQLVVADLRALLEGVNVDVNMPKSAPGCMGGFDDTDCAVVLPNLGLPFGDQKIGEQKFFRVESRR